MNEFCVLGGTLFPHCRSQAKKRAIRTVVLIRLRRPSAGYPLERRQSPELARRCWMQRAFGAMDQSEAGAAQPPFLSRVAVGLFALVAASVTLAWIAFLVWMVLKLLSLI